MIAFIYPSLASFLVDPQTQAIPKAKTKMERGK
jgi:hypothetical protein